MRYSDHDRTLALAGIFQAVSLVQRIAKRGLADSDAMSGSIQSLFKIDAASVSDVYGGDQGVTKGLREICRQLGGEVRRDNELAGYLLGLIQLERKLAGQADRLHKIQEGVRQAQARLAHFPILHSNILASLADLYLENISSLRPRIMVSGEPVYLQNPDNVNRIRSLLLAGIRSAMLWRQTGGRRRQLLFGGKRYHTEATGLLKNVPPVEP